MSAEVVRIADLPAQPWKNGAGITREIAAGPHGATGDGFDWRVSVARIDRDAPFSNFEGIDRVITLLRGAGMRLRAGDGRFDTLLSQRGEPYAFAGDIPVAAALIDGPCEDLNVMVRRGRWHADVTAVDAEDRFEPADAGVVVAIDGAWRRSSAGEPLLPMHAWLWRTAMPAATLQPASPGARAIVVRLSAWLRQAA